MVYADTFNDSLDELIRLLLLLDFSKGLFFISLNDNAASAIKEVTKRKNVEIYMHDWTFEYFLAKEDALQFIVEYVRSFELWSNLVNDS